MVFRHSLWVWLQLLFQWHLASIATWFQTPWLRLWPVPPHPLALHYQPPMFGNVNVASGRWHKYKSVQIQTLSKYFPIHCSLLTITCVDKGLFLIYHQAWTKLFQRFTKEMYSNKLRFNLNTISFGWPPKSIQISDYISLLTFCRFHGLGAALLLLPAAFVFETQGCPLHPWAAQVHSSRGSW